MLVNVKVTGGLSQIVVSILGSNVPGAPVYRFLFLILNLALIHLFCQSCLVFVVQISRNQTPVLKGSD